MASSQPLITGGLLFLYPAFVTRGVPTATPNFEEQCRVGYAQVRGLAVKNAQHYPLHLAVITVHAQGYPHVPFFPTCDDTQE
eukprot:380636-Pelagomonas_calceolata.AAC.18